LTTPPGRTSPSYRSGSARPLHPRAPRCGADYQARISGPLLDRIDLHVEVPALSVADMALPAPREGSAEVAARVAAARLLQADRFAALRRPGLRTNSDADGELLAEVAVCDEPAQALLRRAANQLHLSARGYHRVLRVARSIADLDGSEAIRKPHVAEAVAFRRIARARG
jgi:magnesium chelatase family protein